MKPCPVLVESKTSADFTEAKISHKDCNQIRKHSQQNISGLSLHAAGSITRHENKGCMNLTTREV